MFSGNAEGEMLPHLLYINQLICGQRGLKTGQTAAAIQIALVDGLIVTPFLSGLQT